jgi:hypothetical protein
MAATLVQLGYTGRVPVSQPRVFVSGTEAHDHTSAT